MIKRITNFSLVVFLFLNFITSSSQTIIKNGSVYIKNNRLSNSFKTSSLDFNSILGLNKYHRFKEEDNSKKNILKYNHYYKGIKVHNSTLLVHLKDGEVNCINGNVLTFENINTDFNLSDSEVLEIGKKHLGITELNNIYPVETVIAKNNNSDIKIVKKVIIDSKVPFEMCYLLIDNNEKVLNKVNLYANESEQGTGSTLYYGIQNINTEYIDSNYVLRNKEYNFKTLNVESGIDDVDFVNDSNNWTDTKPEIDAHWGMEKTQEFYSENFSRNNFDNNGSELGQYLYRANYENGAYAVGPPYNNLVYGLGNGTTTTPYVSLDIIGHEFTHLVVTHNGNGGLEYRGEAGALNESFADIFGTCIEFHAISNANWFIAENVSVTNTPIRSLSNPKSFNNPDTYGGEFWVNPFNIRYDMGGVHYNSGVQNYWFYLLSEGGSGTNDNGDNYNINPIGIEKAEQIAYRNLTNYLTANATYLDAYFGSLQSAEDLYGFESNEYNTVKDAWNAVGINEKSTLPNNL